MAENSAGEFFVSDEIKEEFLVDNFDVEGYAQRILESGAAVSEQLAVLAANTVQLDKELRKQISAHHEKLLTQATSIESLEDILDALSQHIATLKANMDRANSRCGELFKKTELRTRQLERLHHTCNLLRGMIRVMQISGKLQQTSSSTTGGRDMVKSSQMLQELCEITEELNLKGVEVIEKDLAFLPKFTKEIRQQTRKALIQGLKSQNHSLVGNALQSFANMKCLKTEIDGYLNELQEELLMDCVRGLGKGGEKKDTQESVTTKNKKGVPGSVTGTNVTPSSVVVRANLWNDVQRLSDTLHSIISQLDVLESVMSKKKDGMSQKKMIEEVNRDLFSSFYSQLGKGLGKEISERSGLVKQTLESEYPKLLRQLSDVFNKIRAKEEIWLRYPEEHPNFTKEDEFGRCVRSLEQAYLSKSLSRLFDSVNMGFTEDSPPSPMEIENIGQVVSSELQVTSFDERLFVLVCKNVGKTVKLFGVKCEQLLSTDGEASQVIGHPSNGQKRNIGVVNALHQLRRIVLSEGKKIEKERGSGGTTPAGLLMESAEALLSLMGSAVRPLLQSVEDAISAIIDTVHQEDFGFDVSKDPHATADQQCSLYMRELQAFVSRVWEDHLSPFHCKDFLLEESGNVAKRAVRQFLIHSSLVRPIGEGGRLRLAADFAQMELAVNPLCRRLSTDLGPDYKTLRSLRRMLFQTPEEIVMNEDVGKDVPYWLVIHLLISQSPSELRSPHVTAGWSITRYTEWLEKHENDSERLQFLQGSLEAYVRGVQSQNKTEYVPTYPLLVQLLKRGRESLKL